jgi:hypothetical protein
MLEQKELVRFLKNMGIPDTEIARIILTSFPELPVEEWPPGGTGLDLMPQINHIQVPDTGSPPYFQPNTTGPTSPFETAPSPDPIGSVKTNDPKYYQVGSNIGHTFQLELPPYQGDDANWLGMANDVGSESSMDGLHGFNATKAIPEWRYNVEDSQMNPLELPPIAIYPSGMLNETEPIIMEYVYQNHDNSDVCMAFGGKTYDMNDRSHRPVPPSEGLGYTNTHPNCVCYWKETGKIEVDGINPEGLAKIQTIHRKIGAKSHSGNLHKVKKDGDLSQRTGHRNYYRKPLKMLREAILEVRHEFAWLSEEYLNRARALASSNQGTLYLIRASQEAITDHRGEGEQYLRKLDGMELMAMARTAIGHGMDINHNPEWRTGATVLDSEYDPNTRSIQMLVVELDPQINEMIRNSQITAVSINGGAPRTETVEPCDNTCSTGSCELCNVPRGVILGELDDIALTWVVTDPRGIMWNGVPIPFAEPGVKTTAIQPI